jgi:hypothetical protein
MVTECCSSNLSAMATRSVAASKLLNRYALAAANPIEVAFAAGLFEGEGSVSAQVMSRRRRDGSKYVKPKRYPRARMRMTDREPIEFMHRLFGGSYRGPLDHPWGIKDMFEWTLSGEASVRLLYATLRQWLSADRVSVDPGNPLSRPDGRPPRPAPRPRRPAFPA